MLSSFCILRFLLKFILVVVCWKNFAVFISTGAAAILWNICLDVEGNTNSSQLTPLPGYCMNVICWVAKLMIWELQFVWIKQIFCQVMSSFTSDCDTGYAALFCNVWWLHHSNNSALCYSCLQLRFAEQLNGHYIWGICQLVPVDGFIFDFWSVALKTPWQICVKYLSNLLPVT